MKGKKTILLVILIIFILGCAYTTSAENIYLDNRENEDIINLGTIIYDNDIEKTLTVKLYNCSEKQNLSLLFSEDINSSAVEIINIWYSPSENMTNLVFKTNPIEVDWFFEKETKYVYFINQTNRLFKIGIDYSDLEIPDDPVSVLNDENNDLKNLLQLKMEKLNQTMDSLDYKNETIVNLQNSLETKNSELIELQESFTDLKNELLSLREKYNETRNDWINSSANASNYKQQYFSLRTTTYGPDNTADGEGGIEGDLRNQQDFSGRLLWTMPFLAIAIFLITVLYFKKDVWFGEKKRTLREAERDTGYSEKHLAIDKFFSSIGKKENNNPGPVKKPSEKQPVEQKNVEDLVDNKISEVDEFKEKHRLDMQHIYKQIDGLDNRLKKVEKA